MAERLVKRGRPKLPIPPKLSCMKKPPRDDESGFMCDNTTWHKSIDSLRGLPDKEKRFAPNVRLENETWNTINGIDMSQADKQNILGGMWLSDNIVNAAQALLKEQYADIGSLQNVLFPEININQRLYLIEWPKISQNFKAFRERTESTLKLISWINNLKQKRIDCLTNSEFILIGDQIEENELILKEKIKTLNDVRELIFECIGLLPLEHGTKFVQIVLDKNDCNHWVCVSNITTNDFNTIRIYDSDLKRINYSIENYSQYLLSTIRRLYCGDPDIKIELPLVTQCSDGCSGGVYAIAFAQTLCTGLDPSDILFTSDTRTMRSHLSICLELGCLSEFPRAFAHPLGTHKIITKLFYSKCEKQKNKQN